MKLKNNSGKAVLLFFALSILLFSCAPSSGKVSHTFIQDQGSIQLYFCPQDDCEKTFIKALDSAQQSLHCALYEIDLPSVKQELAEKQQDVDVKIITDSDYLDQFNHPFVKADSWGLMHDKFCVIDGKIVTTGSMNPTFNDAHKNNNNLLIISSGLLAQNYEDEFQEMWQGMFKKGDTVSNPVLRINQTIIETYFCPEDLCAERVKEELRQAQKSIYFMTFSFTHDGIANVLLLKDIEGITIQGVMETKQISEYSVFDVLAYQGIDVHKDGNKYNLHQIIDESIHYYPRTGIMHHKVFIIDNQTVITGSMNPTKGGDERNDENLLIIHDPEIAARFTDEFWRIYTRVGE